MTSLNAILHGMCVGFRHIEVIEGSMKLAVVCAEIDDSFTFLSHELMDGGVIITLILASYNEDSRTLHSFECHFARIYVSGF